MTVSAGKCIGLGLFVLFLLVTLLPAAANSIDFWRAFNAALEYREVRTGRSDSSQGYVFYTSPSSLKVQIVAPVSQLMFFDGDTLTIYYPAENSGIIMPSVSGPVTLPILQLVVNTLREDLGLEEAGYKIVATDIAGDTLNATWVLKTGAQTLSQMRIALVHDCLLSVRSFNGKGRLVSRQEYTDHLEIDGKYFPRKLMLHRYGVTDYVYEELILRDVKFSDLVPERFDTLHIPDNAVFEMVEW